ncbi:hypothetical protein NDU88_007612 [Pleurodeles waltl]|uniref:Uncharacterized protein n=1 Tax=Pleurodeles waltl TaxID=8319 RepID=A0AAV7PM67_PLEWA|nr:hypothetical protein NDU88_007612 [Pleurodeles waltl]
MAANRVRGGKRKGTDPDLAQLLKLVLAKLGGGDSEGEAAPSDGDDGEVRASRPRRANVAPPAAFPPVKRRNKKQTGETVVQQPTPQAVLTPPSPPVIELVTVVTPSIAAAAPSEEIAGHHAGVRSSSTGVEAMLADIRRSVAALAAPASDVPTQALPIAQGVAPGASAVTEQGQAARAHPGASQDLTTQTLASVSQMLANLTVPVPTPHPTTPWASDPLQNSVLELKRQVEALVAARNVPSLQVATSGPSVSQAPGPLSQTPPGGKEHGKVIEQGGNTIVTPAEVTGADTLLSRPGKLAAHVASEIKEKIWKGDFVDIFSLEGARRDANLNCSLGRIRKLKERHWFFHGVIGSLWRLPGERQEGAQGSIGGASQLKPSICMTAVREASPTFDLFLGVQCRNQFPLWRVALVVRDAGLAADEAGKVREPHGSQSTKNLQDGGATARHCAPQLFGKVGQKASNIEENIVFTWKTNAQGKYKYNRIHNH